MPASHAKRAAVADRRRKLVEYRLEGRAYEDIYEELGYSSRYDASKDFHRTVEANIVAERASVEVYREVEILRLDKMLRALNERVERGEPRAIEVALKVSERRSKLLGLDAAQRLEVLSIDAIDAEIRELTARLGLESAGSGEAGAAAAFEEAAG